MAATKAQNPENPLTVPCHILISATGDYVQAAQRAEHVRPGVTGYDLFLAAVSVAWTMGTAAPEAESLNRLRDLIEHGYREPGE